MRRLIEQLTSQVLVPSRVPRLVSAPQILVYVTAKILRPGSQSHT